jgi:hypothetical protein
VLSKEDAAQVRNRFINMFVDTDSPFYRDRIAKLRRFSDGEFYTGYLWDVVRSYTRISEEQAAALARSLGSSYALWDLHSADEILVPGYWKFPRDAVLYGPAADVYDARSILPTDLYIVRADFEVSLIFTHEDHPDGVPIILEARPLKQGG